MSNGMNPVNRIQENLVAKSERRLLNWLCTRIPSWMNPDHLTTIGLLGSLMIVAGYLFSNFNPLWLFFSVAGYFINWFGDSLDGSLARYRKIERPEYGYFLDHSIDAFTTVLLMLSLGASPYVTFEVAAFTLAGYMLLSVHAFLAARVTGEFKLSYMALGPTELRIVLVAMTTYMYFDGPGGVVWSVFNSFDLVVGGVGSVLLVLFVIQSTLIASRLYTPPGKPKA